MNEDENDVFMHHDVVVFSPDFINYASDYILNNINDNNKSDHMTTT